MIKKKKKLAVREITHGQAHIQATYNNTLITVSDAEGNVLCFSSAGKLGFAGPKKATPYAASIIVKDALEQAKKYTIRDMDIFVKGVGAGRDSAIKTVVAQGFNILSIKDVTPIPHNGCRPPKVRRV
ncbi:MAG: 30S ribosomal protein S11 [Parcubacteria group bacterium]|nr:30S ribosomal protein S11 [Parcubacteria group bacterium]